MSREQQDPFVDGDRLGRIVRGVTVNSNAPRLAELAALIGFDTVWIDVEHGPISYTEVETLCMAVEAGGGIPTVRVANHERETVLRALESGARILVVPMVNTAEQAEVIVRNAKFPPLGQRGFNLRSRGLHYGLDGVGPSFSGANARTHLFPQIESMEAVRNLEAILSVEGLAGVFVGPGDLSASLGKPGAFADAEVIDAVVGVIRKARAMGKHAGILAAPGPLLDASFEAGVDLVFASSDITELAGAWRKLLASLPGK